MSNLTEIEIINEIVRIERMSNVRFSSGVFSTEVVPGIRQEYNPLRNKALLFDLMVKHEVAVTFGLGSVVVHCKNVNRNGAVAKKVDKKDLPRSILECIVEANNKI